MDTSLKDSLSSALLQSMGALAENAASNTKATLTIEAKIVDIIDEGKGIYKVEYLGNTFEAATANNDIIYNIDELVYIIVPEGNFDNNKVILSPVSPSNITYASTEEGASYITLGDNLFASVADVELYTYRPHNAEPIDIDLTGFAQLFQAALKDSRIFNFTCRVKTNIEKSRRTKGNYGLILSIPVIQENEIQNYNVVLDINNLKGDSYNYAEYALQNLYFSLPADMEYDPSRIISISSFVNGFIGGVDLSKPADIWIKDISLLSSFVVNEETMSGYYLSLTASEGNSFLATRTQDTKTITATLYLNSKKTSLTDFDCYWFKENCLVDIENDKYNRLGGIGWEILNGKTEIEIDEGGKENYQYVTNIYQQEVKQSDVHSSIRFKCVLVKGDKIVNQTIILKNLASSVDIKLESATGSSSYVENTGRVRLVLRYYEEGITDESSTMVSTNYAWQRFDKFGNYIDNDFYTIDRLNDKINNYYETEISYSTNKVDEVNTIYCTVYNEIAEGGKVKQIIAGTRSIQISTSAEAIYNIKVENGDKLYKYDADGDSPKVANYDGPLSSAIKTITPINIALFKPDGTEFTADEYSVTTVEWLVPINSMITLTTAQKTDPASNPGYYTIKGSYDLYKSLAYNIANSYNKKKNDNTIIIKAYFKDNIAENVANIRFLKDGEAGTNGTKYSAIVTYNGAGYGEKDINGNVNKLQLIYVSSEESWYKYNLVDETLIKLNYGSIIDSFSVDTYADGEKIANSTVGWNIFDNRYAYEDIRCPFTINSNGEIILKQEENNFAKWEDLSQNFCAIIEAKVRAKKISNDDGQTGSEEYIYAYYPIEMTRVKDSSYLNSIIPTFDGGFYQVVYAADGTNPQYDTNNNFEVINDIDNLYDCIWSSSTNLSTKKNADKSCKVTAVSKFDNGISKNYIKANIGAIEGASSKLALKIAELESQFANENNRLVYYELLQSALDIFQNFDYNNYINDLQTASGFFTEKTNLIKIDRELINSLKNLLEKVNNYYAEDHSVKLVNLRNEILNRINQFTNLLNLSYQLGTDSSIINLIKAVAPNSLLMTNIIVEPTDKSYYISLRDAVIKYNNQINVIYTNYYNQLDEVFIALQSLVLNTFNELNNYINDNKWTILSSTHAGVNEQIYLYEGLVRNLKSYINSLSDNENYSYDRVINNILKPMKKAIDQFKNKNYNEIIIKINKNIDSLTNLLNKYNNIVLPTNNIDIIHIQPIIMLYNRYELSNINGWDGNKLVLDDDGRYIIAPQVGAGIKNNNNTFTGIVMGVKQENSGSIDGQQIGLFGYSSGLQSIFLNAKDGSATFGVAGAGQIIMEPSSNTAIIRSGNYSTISGTGMKIDLTTPEIRFGSGRFIVNSEGNLTASNVDISGKITATSGYIGGWTINPSTLSGGNITLNSNGSMSGATWNIGTDGVATFNKVVITGGTASSAGVGSSMNWGDNFSVDANGNLKCANADVSGKITATSGKIGGISVYSNRISGSNWYLDKDGGQIGGWSIGNRLLSGSGDISLNAETGYAKLGQILCSSISTVGSNGEVYSNILKTHSSKGYVNVGDELDSLWSSKASKTDLNAAIVEVKQWANGRFALKE